MKNREIETTVKNPVEKRELEFFHAERDRIPREIGQMEAKASGLLIVSIVLLVIAAIALGFLRLSQPGPTVNVVGSSLAVLLAMVAILSSSFLLRALTTRKDVEYSIQTAVLLNCPDRYDGVSYEVSAKICEEILKSSLHELKEKSGWVETGRVFAAFGIRLFLF